MKLNELQQQILAFLEMNATCSVPVIAKALGKKQATIRYTMTRLNEGGFLRFRPFIDPYRLGYKLFYLKLRTSPQTLPLTHGTLLSKIVNHENISYAYISGGDFSLRLVLTIREMWELDETITFLNKLTSGSAAELSYIRHWMYWGHLERLVSEKRSSRSLFTLQPPTIIERVDEVDHRVLRELNLIPIFSVSLLARKTGLPEKTLRYRLKRLEERKILLGHTYQAVLHQDVPLQYSIIHLSVLDWDKEREQELVSLCNEESSIGYMAHFTGGPQYDLGIGSPEPQDALRLIRKISDRFAENVEHISLTPVIKKAKLMNYPFKRFLEE